LLPSVLPKEAISKKRLQINIKLKLKTKLCYNYDSFNN
jgi:hypothetical protein